MTDSTERSRRFGNFAQAIRFVHGHAGQQPRLEDATANSIGFLIPYHRVIRETGEVSNYRGAPNGN